MTRGFLIFVTALLVAAPFSSTSSTPSTTNAAEQPTPAELAASVAELRRLSTTSGASNSATALARAMLLLKRLDIHRQAGIVDSEDKVAKAGVQLSRLAFQLAISAPTVPTTDTIGMPGDVAEFRLSDQPDGSVFVCFNASRSGDGHVLQAAADVRPLTAELARVQLRLVPYFGGAAAVAKRALQQLELSVGPLNCWDARRRYSCCAVQPPSRAQEAEGASASSVQGVTCAVYRILVAFC